MIIKNYCAASIELLPQLMQDVELQHEQLEHELVPLVAAVSPSKDASDTSMISSSSTTLNNSSIIVIISLPPVFF